MERRIHAKAAESNAIALGIGGMAKFCCQVATQSAAAAGSNNNSPLHPRNPAPHQGTVDQPWIAVTLGAAGAAFAAATASPPFAISVTRSLGWAGEALHENRFIDRSHFAAPAAADGLKPKRDPCRWLRRRRRAEEAPSLRCPPPASRQYPTI